MCPAESRSVKAAITSGQHPISDGRYVLPTPATEAASRFVIEVVKSHLPGCMVVGRQRFGKTHAIPQIVADLREAFGPSLVIISIQVEFCEEKPGQRDHYYSALACIEHPLIDEGTAPQKKKRFQEWVTEKVASSGQRRAVFLYDDAQFLWEHQYGFLMNDFNHFLHKGIKSTYVLVGQHELLHQKKSFINAGRQQLVGRFMVREMMFHGIRHQEDIRVCCHSYDVMSEFPEGSNASYTQHFFPAAFASGWRLAHEAERIYKAYDDLRSRYSISHKREIGMQYFMPVIEKILTEIGDPEVLQPHVSAQWLEDAIVGCGYVSAELGDLTTK